MSFSPFSRFGIGENEEHTLIGGTCSVLFVTEWVGFCLTIRHRARASGQ